MMEPLSIKSEQNAQTQRRKGGTITAIELISKFTMKSPSNQRICLTERAPSSGRNIKTSTIRHSESISTIMAFNKNKGEVLAQLKDQGNRKGEKVTAKVREQEKGNSNCRENIVRMINEISKKAKNGGKIDLPVRKIVKDKENICLTERSKTPQNNPKSPALKMTSSSKTHQTNPRHQPTLLNSNSSANPAMHPHSASRLNTPLPCNFKKRATRSSCGLSHRNNSTRDMATC